ncbi:MAG: ATP-dependent metallopeptidase FtsH/Yme1/Tma family protein, partial [Candidatus Dormibacteraceae bacterium]
MDPGDPKSKRDMRPKPPRWSSPIWYLPIMLLLLWLWQGAMSQLSYRSIPYSEFKDYLHNHEVTKCVIREDDIQGEITPKATASNEAPASP